MGRLERLCKLAVGLWGSSTQMTMMIEEAAELIKALCKYRREGGSIPDYLIEEIADVEIMLAQMRYLFGGKRVDELIEAKLVRLEERIRISLRLAINSSYCSIEDTTAHAMDRAAREKKCLSGGDIQLPISSTKGKDDKRNER